MPDDPKPDETKRPIRFVFPRGISAEEAAKRVKELVEKYKVKPAGDHDGEREANDGNQAR
jgi:hypothetical protein